MEMCMRGGKRGGKEEEIGDRMGGKWVWRGRIGGETEEKWCG